MVSKKVEPLNISKVKKSLSRRGFLQNSAGVTMALGAGSYTASTGAQARAAAKAPQTSACSANEMSVPSSGMERRYERAQTILQGAHFYKGKKIAINTALTPHWIGNSDHFWYERETWEGKKFQIVDARNTTNRPAFDHKMLAHALAKKAGKNIDPENLPITNFGITLSPRSLTFEAFGKSWVFDEAQETCKEKAAVHPDGKVSPDGKKVAFIRDYNLWVQDVKTGKAQKLTDDGEQFHCYGNAPTVLGAAAFPIKDFIWSPDSKKLATCLINTRNVRGGTPLVQHVPMDGTIRPTVVYPGRRVAISGDENVETWQLCTVDIVTGAMKKIDHRALPISYPPYWGFFPSLRGWWDKDSRTLYFVDQESDQTQTKLCIWDSQTGKTMVRFAEDPDLRAALNPKTHPFKFMIKYLPETNELIWYSERSGWAHLYLYNLKTGKLKNAITRGNWLVRSILSFNAQSRELVIQSAGRVKGRNPYYQDICRVNIDTGRLVPVVSTDHEYDRCSASPSGRYVVATRSQVDEVPKSTLWDVEGRKVMSLETADLSGMPYGWKWPKPFKFKATDGEDIYGVIYYPPDFSPDKLYPVLDYSFLHYLEPTGSFIGGYHYLEGIALAELGFIVLNFFTRKITGARSATFRDKADYTVPYYNLADNAEGIRQLAKRHAYIDADRVGASIHSSLPIALVGLLLHPDLYKVGVSINALTDARLMTGSGPAATDYPPLEDFAGNLKGKLLLAGGMLDWSIPISSTFRMVEALKREDKDFDMLLLPNFGHSVSSYITRRSWDYFVEHLLGGVPPKNFKLKYMLGD
ncbi:MAG: DPP IV N-terminal domain-containing protein [Spongiibacteraceae bacterium]|nr:DPP IV N-terminal domain-containing protein [Spongiibacteraceae bacterium]